jgi:hypothetical protein
MHKGRRIKERPPALLPPSYANRLLKSFYAGVVTPRMRAACLASLTVLAVCFLPAMVAGQRRRQLTDETFEHLTQAATGQTTGAIAVSTLLIVGASAQHRALSGIRCWHCAHDTQHTLCITLQEYGW